MIPKHKQLSLGMATAAAVEAQARNDGKACFREFFPIQSDEGSKPDRHPRPRIGKTRYDRIPAKQRAEKKANRRG